MDFLRLIADLRIPAFDILFQSITWMAEETFVIVIMCWLYWCHDKILAYTLGFTYFLSGLLVQGLKLIFRIPRPWVLDPDFQPVETAVKAATGFSFPSGHTQSGTALFSTLGFAFKKKWLKIFSFLLICLIGFSRMYLGVHTPKDVLTALCLTLLLSYFVTFHLQKKFMHPDNAKYFSILLFAVCTILMLYTCYFYFTFPECSSMAKSSFKACGAGYGFALGFYLERTKVNFELPKSGKEKFLRFFIGLISVAALLLIFKLTIKKFLIGNIFSYILLIVWIVAIYPYIFSKLEKKSS